MPIMLRINGSPSRPSKSGILIDAIANAIASAMSIESHAVTLSDIASEYMCGLMRADVTPKGEEILRLVERADLLVVGTPIYRASYTGILKHFFDLVDRDVMRGRKAVLCATGASEMHSLALEHQLRPLMAFFAIHSAPTAVYGTNSDFAEGRISNPSLRACIDRAAGEAINLLALPFSPQIL